MSYRAFPAELSDAALFSATERYGDLGVHAIVDVRRRFPRDEIEHAVQGAIAAFPVLGRRYEPGAWRDRWRVVEGPVGDAIHVGDAAADLEDATAAWARRPIDVTRERPIRVTSLTRPGGSRLILSLSHIAADGGGMAAVGNVLGARLYGVPTIAPVERRRSVSAALAGLGWRHLPVLARDALGTLGMPLRLLRAGKRDRPFSTGRGEASWRHLRIRSADLEQIKARCRPAGASVNDALIAALARVATTRSSSGPVVVMYTMDLRRYAGAPRLTAANTSTILVAIVPRESVGDLATTAGAVAAITAKQRRGLVGPASILVPLSMAVGAPHAWVRQMTHWLEPVLVDLPLRRGLMVTNIGRLDDGLATFGEDIESVRVIGPSVRGVDVPTVVAFGFRGELHLQLFAAPGLAPAALEELESGLRRALELDEPHDPDECHA